MDEHIIETDQIEDGYVVLVVPSLQLIVMGRTLEEARARARSAIGGRGPVARPRAEQSPANTNLTRPVSSNAA